jgi:hypothetical protein
MSLLGIETNRVDLNTEHIMMGELTTAVIIANEDARLIRFAILFHADIFFSHCPKLPGCDTSIH